MMALAKCFINDLSVEVLEYPEITIPEQGLKRKFYLRKELCELCRFVLIDWTLDVIWSPLDRFWSSIPQIKRLKQANQFYFVKSEVRGPIEA